VVESDIISEGFNECAGVVSEVDHVFMGFSLGGIRVVTSGDVKRRGLRTSFSAGWDLQMHMVNTYEGIINPGLSQG
jgi:hypothetical protein